VQGTYVFRLTVTDNSGATGTDDVTVTVNAAANQVPVANAGNNIILTLPTNSTTLTGSGTDADGTISSYAWTRVSGPTTFTFGSSGAATTTLTGLVQGTYTFRLTVTDNSGATSTDDVTVTVNASAPANQAPIANAGSNIVINLPVNSTSLNGSNSLDLDGTITGYAWSRVSGPATFTFGNANAATTTLSSLVQGTYVFRLTVTDNSGATDIDNIVVTVNAAANQVPAVNAGNNIIITLPVNSTTLTGSGSDLDGTITAYAWSRVSGPTNFAFGNAASAATALTNLVQGTYVFRLTVTDNSGATATDDVNVTVNPAVVPNQAPVARAGNDIVITLPVNYTTLNGNTSTDPDGVIVSYSWSRISGPATFTFTSAGSIATGLNNLVQGIYVFRLTVTDNSGVTATDNITVTVNAAAVVAVNQAPIARIGNDILLTLPANSTSLSGTSSTDADGSIVGYEWTQLSGPSPAIVGNRLSVSSSVTGLMIGEYRFSLKVTDNNGASSTATVKVTVSDKSGDGITLNLYPNPASVNLTVRYSDAANGKLRLSVYDATRKLVKDEMADKTQVTFTKTIDVNILETGTYILQVVLPDGKTVAKQFVKM
jgi:ribosomal protein L14